MGKIEIDIDNFGYSEVEVILIKDYLLTVSSEDLKGKELERYNDYYAAFTPVGCKHKRIDTSKKCVCIVSMSDFVWSPNCSKCDKFEEIK